MHEQKIRKIALVGNPNSGKSTIFNHLTRLHQKVGNYPGITVEKRTGYCILPNNEKIEITDFPGTYSIYPNTSDEKIVFDILVNKNSPNHPDVIAFILDASNFKRNMLLFSQIYDLGIPVILVLNMIDLMNKRGDTINEKELSALLSVPVISINGKSRIKIEELKIQLSQKIDNKHLHSIFDIPEKIIPLVKEVKNKFNTNNDYSAYQLIQQSRINNSLEESEKKYLVEIAEQNNFEKDNLRRKETLARYVAIDKIIEKVTGKISGFFPKVITEKLDKIFTHRIWGYVIFLSILFLIFQSIFTWASWPMDLIDNVFSKLTIYLKELLPTGYLSNLIVEGIIPGIGGILIFIPQIAILFAYISILEESGYLARVVFLNDKLMRKVGLSGKSIVPLISGVACAIPAIMSTRNIENWKERIITIFITPLMSCSARLPVFTIIIAVIIPSNKILGWINLQGIVLMLLYLLGFLMAILTSFIMKLILKTKEKSFLVMELPVYKTPSWTNVGYSMFQKSKSFVLEAGKIILAISVILWAMASFGPNSNFNKADEMVALDYPTINQDSQEYKNKIKAYKLEHSYAGIFGKWIEPAIAPLGYDWKIGIALLTSFVAREVFVSTMATIYSIGDTDEENTIKNRLKSEINPKTNKVRYDLATGLSLLVFYVFAMQCVSTLAVVYKETNSWKWPVIQLIYMTFIAYLFSWITYVSFS